MRRYRAARDCRRSGRSSSDAAPRIADAAALERKLYVIRKRATNEARASLGLRDRELFYFCSLSAVTIVYKGQLISTQIPQFYPDLIDPDGQTALAMVHQRFSTNTFPSWDRAHPYRFVAHNGEINTLRGNINWMHAREKLFASPLFGDDIHKLHADHRADRQRLRDVRQLPRAAGAHRPLAAARRDDDDPGGVAERPADDERGQARVLRVPLLPDGAVGRSRLDRVHRRRAHRRGARSQRPAPLALPGDQGRLRGDGVRRPACSTSRPRTSSARAACSRAACSSSTPSSGRIVDDEEIKGAIAARQPYRAVARRKYRRDSTGFPSRRTAPPIDPAIEADELLKLQQAFGYTDRRAEDAAGADGGERAGAGRLDGHRHAAGGAVGSSPLLFNYFKQLFAQVTNPPIDPIREEMVMSARDHASAPSRICSRRRPMHCRQLQLKRPILTNAELEKIRAARRAGPAHDHALDAVPRRTTARRALRGALDASAASASEAIERGLHASSCSPTAASIATHAPIPSLLAAGAVHHHLIREGTRTRCGMVVESGEPREVMHFCLLVGYGAGAVNPYLAFATMAEMIRRRAAQGRRRGRARSSTSSRRSQEPDQGRVEDGHLDAAELSRRADLRGHRAQPRSDRPVLHLDRVAHRRRRPRRDRARDRASVIGTRSRSCREPRRRTRRGRPVPMAPARRVPHVQPQHHREAAARGALGQLQDVQGIHAAGRRSQPHLATLRGLLKFKPDRPPVPIEEVEPAARDRQALQDRRDVVRLDQQGGAREPRDRDEPHRRQDQHRRGRRGSRALRARCERRLAPQRDQAGRLGALRRHQLLPGQRRRAADQDGAGRQARRGRPAARPQGRRLHREDSLLDARRRADFAAASSRHLFDRGPRAAHPRSEELQRPRAHQRQAGRRGRRRHGRRRRLEGQGRRGADQRTRRRHRRLAADFDQARRRAVGARPRRDPADPGDERSARPHPRRDRRPAQDRPRRRDRCAARRRGIRLRQRGAGRLGMHHDARVPSQHLPGRYRDAGSRAAQEVRGQARARGQLHDVHRRGDARVHGAAWASAASTRWSGASNASTATRRSSTGRRATSI